jgi:23S rRNA pseudouridine1911/1915/1917 synthase
MGHPVVGDPLYGASEKVAGSLGRYFLHAHRVRFEQPTTGASITVISPLPAGLESWMNGLEAAPGTAGQNPASNGG